MTSSSMCNATLLHFGFHGYRTLQQYRPKMKRVELLKFQVQILFPAATMQFNDSGIRQRIDSPGNFLTSQRLQDFQDQSRAENLCCKVYLLNRTVNPS